MGMESLLASNDEKVNEVTFYTFSITMYACISLTLFGFGDNRIGV